MNWKLLIPHWRYLNNLMMKYVVEFGYVYNVLQEKIFN